MNGHCGHMNHSDLRIEENGSATSMTGGAMRRHCKEADYGKEQGIDCRG